LAGAFEILQILLAIALDTFTGEIPENGPTLPYPLHRAMAGLEFPASYKHQTIQQHMAWHGLPHNGQAPGW